MSLASFFANKCLEYLLKDDASNFRQQRPGGGTPLHPPWSLAAETFKFACSGCGNCAAVCEQNVIVMARGGLPVMDFSRGFCTFCGACAKGCSTGALRFDEERRGWPDVCACIGKGCLLHGKTLCRTCSEQCGKGAIVFSSDPMQPPAVLPEKCDGCGACCGACPVGAIFVCRSGQQNYFSCIGNG